ncbi:MAG: hypothetical protein LIO87_05360 [Eubacterium sp.]|nr:hypothetical protein [Eubacterium sp.]
MKKNILSVVTAITAAAVMTCSVFAYAPSYYDGTAYSDIGYTSEDPDGEINLAVIADSDVYIGGNGSSMYVQGSIYSNGNIYVNNGGGNDVDGLLISGTEGTLDSGYNVVADRECCGYIHFADDGSVTNAFSTTLEYEGYIDDQNTSFECSYTDYTVPSISNVVDEATANEYWPGAITVSENTYYKKLNASGACLIIDATNNDVTVVIDALYAVDGNPEILTVGSNKVNIYINDFYNNSGAVTDQMNFAVVSQDVYNSTYGNRFNNMTDVEDAKDYFKTFGDPTNTNVYINSSTDSVVFTGGAICGNIYSNADSLTIAGSAEVLGNIYSGASDFTITGGGTFVEGTVCVPNADSQVIDSGTLIGQLHTYTIHMNGAGSIYYQADAAATAVGTTETTTEGATETTTIDTETVYGVLGAKVIWYNVDRDTLSDGYELGRIKLVGHTPDGEGHDNKEGISNKDLHYTVLDENTYYHTDEQLSETDWNEAVRRVTKIYEISQMYLDSNTSGENAIEVPTVFGRIDSNGYKSSLTVTPYAQAEIKAEAGDNMYVCIADGNGEITDVLMIIDDTVQYEDAYEGNISPYVYNFTSNGYMTYASILEKYKDSCDY